MLIFRRILVFSGDMKEFKTNEKILTENFEISNFKRKLSR